MNYLNKLLILLFVIVICSCSKDDDNQKYVSAHIMPTFVTSLHPVDEEGQSYNVANNVIQGIASFEDGWFVAQTSGNSVLLLNYLNAYGESLFRKRIYVDSHGQDLSVEVISENELYLYTTIGAFGENRNTGILKLKVLLSSIVNDQRDWSSTSITVENQFDLNYSNSTPALNEDKSQFAIRSANTIYVHNKTNVESLNFNPQYNFQLHPEQLSDNGNYSMFFQGIAMKDNNVFCLAGNEKIGTHKNIFVYNQNGLVTDKFTFDRNDLSQNFYDKFEPEALTFKNDELYFSIMTKSEVTTGNIKYLYKINL